VVAQNPPVWMQTRAHPAEPVRRWLQAAMWSSSGVLGAAEMVVSVGTGLGVSVADGRCVIAGTENAYQGTYYCENRGAATVALAGANATNPRIDLIVACVRDSVYSGSAASDGFTIEAVTGTAAASPVAPATPANSIVLARVTVPAGVTNIVAGNIVDTRPLARRPGLQPFTDGDARAVQYPSPNVGDLSYLTASQRYEWWNGTAWVRLAPIVTVSTAAPSGGENGDVWVQVV
jgi:hypothetical protein